FGNGDSEMMIGYFVREFYGDNKTFQKMLREWIYQPGKAILFVSREKAEIIITQSRFHSTAFNDELRDIDTRWTIPISYTVNGIRNSSAFRSRDHSISIPINDNSSFSIDAPYGQLYSVYFTNPRMILGDDGK
ncbi:hypothetical protein PFISCL1PPCAC_5491, partial [Pristionchus fissidentatus]